MKRICIICLFWLFPAFAAWQVKSLGQEEQRAEIKLYLSKEKKGVWLSLPNLHHLDFLKEIITYCKSGGLQISIITKKTKKNLDGIEYLKKNQIPVFCLPQGKKGSMLSYLVLENQKSASINIEPLFRKTTYSKIPLDVIWAQDEKSVDELILQFMKDQKECIP